MDDFSGILERDFGFRPGKAAPMAAAKAPASGSAARPPAGTASWNKSRSEWNTDSLLGDRSAGVSGSGGSPPAYDDVFLGAGGYSNSASRGRQTTSASKPPTDFDSIFDGFKDSAPKPANSSPPPSSMPVYDKPVYDDDIFDGVPGLKTTSSVNYDDVFASMASASDRVSPPPYEDLLENLGKPVPKPKGAAAGRSASGKEHDLSGFDDLIPGFGGSSPPNRREPSVPSKEKPVFSSAKPTAPVEEDPFRVFESVSASTYSSSGLFTDPLEHIGRPVSTGNTKVDTPPVSVGPFDELSKSVPSFATEASKSKRDQSPKKYSQDMNPGLHSLGREPSRQSSMDAFENILPTMRPSKTSDSQKPVTRNGFHSYETDDNISMAEQSPKYHEHMETADDIWLTVAEIPLFTQPTNAPPPLRPPPPLATKQFSANRNDNEFPMQSTKKHPYFGDSVRKSDASPIDELEDFAMGKPQIYTQDRADFFTGEEEIETSSTAAASAAAMKEAMDRAEAKFKHAKEVRERERDAKAKTRESQQQERDFYGQDSENKEEQEILDRQREEDEKEQRRLERVREQELERERERKAVERATREARERAAAEARQRAEREKVEAERRERERAAVQRAAAEARQRAAAEARQRVERERAERERAEKERAERDRAERERAERERSERERADRERVEREKAERDAAEARERASAERLRAERMAVERAAAEARKRAAEDARRRAAAAAAAAAAATEEKQRKAPEEDLESFFGMGARATSAPTQRPTSSDNLFNSQSQTKGPHNTSSVSSSTIKKASSATNIVDDLSAIFGGPPSSGEFQDIEGESEERRRARLERHQRTAERAQKALAEKNERDRQAQMEQAERHRIGEALDFEIKRWAAGKEGNLRALLSTLQYVLWPECGWQPVSLTDLITAAAVKKVYRKATLCIHPDKVQQKGATIQQKYIAEKVFDLLKEAWNKFNSEELF